MSATVKVQIVFPGDLLRAVDQLVGGRKRSEFVVAATRERLSRLRFLETLQSASGCWSAADHPETRDVDTLDRWLRKRRSAGGRRLPE